MAREYNESSYYRANPYYQQGYLPSSAFNNRKELDYMSEMPQGREYFVITGKKHYQHLSHKSNIQEDHLMQYIEETPMLAKAKSKGYFRSLNITDIEGASTNTLISQGVKNKLKALEQLKRQKTIQLEALDELRKQKQGQASYLQYESVVKLRKNIPPTVNYHELQRRMKTDNSEEESQQMNRQGRENKGEYIKPEQGKQSKDERRQEKQYKVDKSQSHLDKQIQELKKKKKIEQEEYLQNQLIRKEPRMSSPIGQMGNRWSIEQQRQYQKSEQHNGLQLDSKRLQWQNKPSESLEQKPQNNQYKYIPYKDIKNQLRKYSPTYLSFGSPTIGLAGRNIVGL